MKNFVPFNIVDEDRNTVSLLKKIIEKIFPNVFINAFYDGMEGWNYISSLTDKQVIISGINIPGIGGFQLLKNIRGNEQLKNAYFLFITDNRDKEYNLKLIQLGSDDFIPRQLSPDEIFGKLRAGYRLVNSSLTISNEIKLVEDLKKEIEEYALKVQHLLFKLQKSRMPWIEDLIGRITEAAEWMAAEYGVTDEKELNTILESCKLAYIGKLFLSDSSIKTPITVNGQARNETMSRVPLFVNELIGEFSPLNDISFIVSHIYENFDGSGMPDKLQAWQIPLGSRILRLVIDFEEIHESKKGDPSKVIEVLEAENKRLYDFKLTTLLDQYWASKAKRGNVLLEKPVEIKEIKSGMILARNIITESGMKLMVAGTVLDAEKVEKILSLSEGENIIGKIYIKN